MGWDAKWTPEGSNDKKLAEEIAQKAERSPDDFSIVNAILSKAEVWENVGRLAVALLRVRCGKLEGSELDELLPNCDPVVCKMAEC
jgi:hypothetical protein